MNEENTLSLLEDYSMIEKIYDVEAITNNRLENKLDEKLVNRFSLLTHLK